MNQRIWLLLLAAIGVGLLGMVPVYAVSNPENWNVNVGGESSDMSLQGLGFYPGIITVNEGDNITWTIVSHEPHTISFLTGQPPMPGSQESLSVMGGSEFDGTENVSSGILNNSETYTLTFTKNGTYPYMCLLHPGMAGVVIVNPAGTKYPENQKAVTKRGDQEFSLDMDSGNNLTKNLVENMATVGSNGNTIFHVNADIPLPTNAAVDLMEVNGSNASGTANLDFIGPGELQVNLSLKGLEPNSVHPTHIHIGDSKSGGPILYPLNDINADENGDGESSTVINGPAWFAIADRGWFINVHQGPTMEGNGSEPIASGDIIKNGVSLLRFSPDTLNIKINDEVVWNQLNSMMVHTVSFLEPGQIIPDLIMPDFTLNPNVTESAGGDIMNESAFHNSGILEPGDTYNLTFTTPGTFKYVCLIHDNMKMGGTVQVVPSNGSITGKVINDANGNGHKDANETGLEGWTIKLLGIINESKVVTDQTTTDVNGTYMFGNLAIGNYYISEEVQNGFVPTTDPFKHVKVSKPKTYKKNFFDKPEVSQ